MTTTHASFRALIDLWPSLDAFANDLGVPYQTAASMRLRDAIHSRYWERLVAAAWARNIRVSFRQLAKLAANENRPARAEPARDVCSRRADEDCSAAANAT